MRSVLNSLALLMTAASVSACAGAGYDKDTGLYARPTGGAPATQNDTVYSSSLRCLAGVAKRRTYPPPRIAVGEIADLTGRNDLQTGRTISQGAALFAISGLTKAGLPAVERLDRGVSEVERRYAQNHLLSDTPEQAGTSGENFRPVFAGEIAGSSYYIVGGVTELNYNLRSRGADLAAGAAESAGLAGRFTGSDYVLNVAVDLRLIDTVSQEVAATASYQKQIVGREVRLGVFDFLNGNIFDLSIGGSALEPTQFAVRTVVERGLYDFAADLYSVPRTECLAEAGPSDPSLLSSRAASVDRAHTPVPVRVLAPTPARKAEPAARPSIDPETWRVRGRSDKPRPDRCAQAGTGRYSVVMWGCASCSCEIGADRNGTILLEGSVYAGRVALSRAQAHPTGAARRHARPSDGRRMVGLSVGPCAAGVGPLDGRRAGRCGFQSIFRRMKTMPPSGSPP